MKQTRAVVMMMLTVSGLMPADTTRNFCMYVVNV